jgi:hypothetical protein
MLSLYKALIRLRRENDVLSVGTFRLVNAEDGVLVYMRELAGCQVLVALNMTNRQQILGGQGTVREALLSTHLDDPVPSDSEEIHLRANEGLIFRMLSDAS